MVKVRLLAFALASCALLATTWFCDSAWASKSLFDSIGQSGELGGQFNGGLGPESIAVRESTGDMYVIDSANNRLQRFDADGKFLAAWGIDTIQAGGTGDQGATAFEVCTIVEDCKAGSDQPISGVNPGGQMDSPGGVSINQATGDVYVSNGLLRRIEVFTGDGNFIRAFGKDVVQVGKPGDLGSGVLEVCTVVADCKAGVAGGEVGSSAISSRGHSLWLQSGLRMTGISWLPITEMRVLASTKPVVNSSGHLAST